MSALIKIAPSISPLPSTLPKLYCIVDTDNFNGEYPDEKFLQLGNKPLLLIKEKAEALTKYLNNLQNHPESPRFWQTKQHPYSLQPGFEP